MTKSLAEELLAYNQAAIQRMPEERRKLIVQATEELAQSSIAKGLTVNEIAPDFSLPNPTGKSVRLAEVLKKGPVVVTFYRGSWCPYCNLQLRAYQEILNQIHQFGADLVAISPQTPDHSMTIQEKHDLKFHVLSDIANKIANEYKLVFTLPDYLIENYKQMGLDIPSHNGDHTWSLPIPATYVIGTDRRIRYAFVNPDYTKRAEPDEILAILKEMTK